MTILRVSTTSYGGVNRLLLEEGVFSSKLLAALVFRESSLRDKGYHIINLIDEHGEAMTEFTLVSS